MMVKVNIKGAVSMTHQHSHSEHGSELPYHTKLAKIIKHWIKHNEDHCENYKKWSQTSSENDFKEVSKQLEEVTKLTDQISLKLKEALSAIPK